MTRKNRRIISDVYSDKSRNLNIKTPPKNELPLRPAKRPLFRLGALVKGGLTVLISVLIVFTVVKASTVKITPPSGAPVATGYSLSEIYNFISSNTPATEGSPALDWSAPLEDTGRTLTEIYNALANLISADKVKEGTIYLGVTGTLIPSGGTATTGNVLSGATFYGASQTNWTLQNGSMANNGVFGLKASSSNQLITAGYYSGGTLTGDTNLTSGNIKSGISVFGVNGSSKVLDTTSGTAANGDLLSGKIAFANGAQINGSMANIGQQKINPGTASTTITAGYHNGLGYCNGDANLVATNIKSGVSIFGVPGNLVAGYLYGSSSASQVLTSAGAGAGTYNATNISVGTVKSGTTFGVSLTGQYPSASYPLPSASATIDLAASGNNISSANGAVEFWKSDGTYQTATLNFPALSSVCVNATSNNSAGTLNPSAISIGVGNTLCGVAGTLLANEHNGSAGANVLDPTFYAYNNSTSLMPNNTVLGFFGGADDYNNGQTSGGFGVMPADSYVGAGWFGTASPCNAGNTYCGAGAGAVSADNKDLSTGLVWSKWATSTTQTWFWANNCYEPNTTQNPGTCVSSGDDACQCVKKPAGSRVGCEALDGGGIWRTPTQKELMQVYIDGSWKYLSSANNTYWSATTRSNFTDYGWYVSLSNGFTYTDVKTFGTTYRVRCVR